MTTPAAQTPGGQREDAALEAGAAVAAIMSAATLRILALLADAVKRGQRKPFAGLLRRARARSGVTLAEALAEANRVLDRAELDITQQTVAALTAAIGKTLELPADLRTGSWGALKAKLRGAVHNAAVHVGDAVGDLGKALANPNGVILAQRVLDELADLGLTAYVDRTGRRWSIVSYSDMATRTAASRLALAVQLHAMGGANLDLVVIDKTSVEPGCPKCLPYEYRVLSLTGATPIGTAVTVVDGSGQRQFAHVKDTLARAVAHGLLHPSCRHFPVPYVDGMTMTTPLPSARDVGPTYVQLQRQRTLERQVHRHEAARTVALDPLAKARANRRLAAARLRLHQHVSTYHRHERKAG